MSQISYVLPNAIQTRQRRDAEASLNRVIRSIGGNTGTNLQMIQLVYPESYQESDPNDFTQGDANKPNARKNNNDRSGGTNNILVAVIVVLLVIVLVIVVGAFVYKSQAGGPVAATATAVSLSGEDLGTEI